MGAISFSLDERLLRFFKAQLPLELFVETGTFRGDTLALARPFFQRCLSVELSPELHRQAQARFAGVEGVEVLCGPSPELLRARQAGHQAIPTLFWLDAHWCVAEHTSGEESQSPLLGELRALGGLHRDSVVLIDDARLYLCPPPQPHRFADWPEWHDIVRTLLELSPGHRLARIFHSRERTGGFCGGARFGFPNGVVHRLWFAGHKARQVRGRVISAICQEMWRQCSPGWNFWKGPGLPMVVSRRPDTTRPALGHSARSSTAPATPDSSAPALGAHSP